MFPRRAAVIGSGFGGLSLAIRLQAAGIATTLFEQRDKPGGRAYVYEDQGFTFDGGPTVITDPTCLEEVFEAAGRRLSDYVELIPVSPFYRLLWPDGRQFDYVNDQAGLDAQIQTFDPADVEGYRRFLAYSQAVFEEGYLKLGAVPFLNFSDMMKAGPNLVKLQAWRSVYSMVSSFVKDEHLREAFSFHSLLVGGNPFSTSSIYALIHALERKWGVFFPRGGTGALVRGMVRLFEDLGGEVHLSTPVDEIVLENGIARAVRLKGGQAIPFDVVASNADVVHTYSHLLRGDSHGRAHGAKLAKMRHSMSLFVTYFGANRTWDHLQHHTVLFGPRYRGLVDEIFKGPSLPEDFSLYLHAPTVTDPTLAPPGCTAFYVLSPVPHLGKADIDWEVEGPRYRDRILAHLEARLLPGLRDSLVTTRMLTPFGFRDELSAHLGSAFSVEPILTQSAWFRPHNRDDRVPNLYFTGAGTHPGAGVPGVVGSAKATAGLILADLGVVTA
ncbi:phytoene desaturase [Xanthobacter autotrophicus DSM 431]|uniref:phytoene desaturase n=1 Tax=Xanthobacter nonsaccharivorans TaxID=3119912 RepID=UPI00372A023A